METGTTYAIYNLATFVEEKGAIKTLEKVKRSLEGQNKTWEKSGWTQFITTPTGIKVLVVHKSRIAHHIIQQREDTLMGEST